MNKKAISIILAIMLVTSLSACGKKGDIYLNTDLSQYKTDYVGDAPNVVNIVSHQEYSKEYSYDSIEIQSKTEPFGLTIFLKGDSSIDYLRLLHLVSNCRDLPLLLQFLENCRT